MLDEDRAPAILARKHGSEPFSVVVVHGGPGAAGEMGPVAQQLGYLRGVLEPMQSATTVYGQIDELRMAVELLCVAPVVLIGHSWGAWLTCFVAAMYPRLVRKMILIGAPAFEEKYVPLLRDNRLKRLTQDERQEFIYLADMLNRPAEAEEANAQLGRLGDLAAKTDSYDPIPLDFDLPRPSISSKGGEIYAGVWPEAAAMRRTGEILAVTTRIECPVVAIHGDYDPTPVEAVAAPLAASLADFHMVVLEKCGHDPWRERWAADKFYETLERQLTS
jgi:pimeloyl-ACP methyl ester carboxylesterase